MADFDEQLALIHIGIIVKHFITDETIPDSLADVAALIEDKLGVKVHQGDRLEDLRSRIMDAYIDQYVDGATIQDSTNAFDNAMKGI